MGRKITSMVLFLSGIIVLLTSVVLYIEPHGRVAYWADWKFLWLSKGEWDGIHITTGVLFLVAGCVHLYYNWRIILASMKNKASQLVFMTRPTVVALVLTLYVAVGTLLGVPPMQQVLDFSEYIKDGQGETLGSPPYGHAELSLLKKFAGYMGIGGAEAVSLLAAQGVEANGEQTLLEIAERNETSPQRIFEIIKKAAGGKVAMPATPPEGLGKMRFDRICSQYGLDARAALQYLARQGLQGIASANETTLKNLARQTGHQPVEIYRMLREFSLATP